MNEKEMHLYDYIVESDIATADELNLARNLMGGTWEEVLNAVLYVRTGYHNLQQLIDEEEEEAEDDFLEVGQEIHEQFTKFLLTNNKFK